MENAARDQLVEMARHNIDHAQKGTIDQEADVFRVPAANYFDPGRFKLEVDRIFKRLPLVLAATAELREAGAYKAMDVVGMPVLLTRGNDGQIRAFINSCSHRGAPVVTNGCGKAKRFVCGYHAWTFDQKGKLVAIASKEDFGDIDMDAHGLVPLPVTERAGLIWVILDPESPLDMDAFLSGYDTLLGEFGLENWHLFEARTLKGPNWKIAFDGYLDLYHLPVLHRETFGEQMSNRALYYAWGPHQRVTSPSKQMVDLLDIPEDKWNRDTLSAGVWTIFPHISIASFRGGGRSIMLSQLFPGDTPGESYTTQMYLMENEPDEAQRQEAFKQFKLLEYVVQEEDYATGLRQQKALESGARKEVLFGRNEGGGHRFHRWVDRILETPDDQLNALFRDDQKSEAA
jgi:phenylpropionate dioxygenase-like ring-hydroxylating dioxygenase large terminal subunit